MTSEKKVRIGDKWIVEGVHWTVVEIVLNPNTKYCVSSRADRNYPDGSIYKNSLDENLNYIPKILYSGRRIYKFIPCKQSLIIDQLEEIVK